MNKIIHGDCLIESEQIASGSVDLILTDLPYGTMKTTGLEVTQNNRTEGRHEWDEVINPVDIYSIANRILRKNGKMVLFGNEPYTTKLINEAIPNVPFSYRAIWEKDNYAMSLGCKRAMVGYYEDILVFSKMNPKHDHELKHPIRLWLKTVQERAGLFWDNDKLLDAYMDAGICKNAASAKVTLKHLLDWDYAQIQKITKKHYDVLDCYLNFDKTVEEIDALFNNHHIVHLREEGEKHPSTFNLWEGKKYKSNILKYAKDYDGYHPTQKPVLLLEDLIKTFSNEGDLVVDLTAGSGSTAVACINTGRNYIVIEKEKKYIDIINKRIAEHEIQGVIM